MGRLTIRSGVKDLSRSVDQKVPVRHSISIDLNKY